MSQRNVSVGGWDGTMGIGGSVKVRGTCHRCGAERILRKDGTLPQHRYGDQRDVVCPGTWRTPESTEAAVRVEDSTGEPVSVGQRVRALDRPVGIVTGIEHDFPTDVDPGTAWLVVQPVTVQTDGTAVSVGETYRVKPRRCRVSPPVDRGSVTVKDVIVFDHGTPRRTIPFPNGAASLLAFLLACQKDYPDWHVTADITVPTRDGRHERVSVWPARDRVSVCGCAGTIHTGDQAAAVFDVGAGRAGMDFTSIVLGCPGADGHRMVSVSTIPQARHDSAEQVTAHRSEWAALESLGSLLRIRYTTAGGCILGGDDASM